MEALPKWVRQFNKSDAVEDLISQGWSLRDAPESYAGSMADNTPYEGTWRGGERPTFPYDLEAFEEDNGGQDIIKGISKISVSSKSVNANLSSSYQ